MYPQMSRLLFAVTVSTLVGCAHIPGTTDLAAGFQISNPFSKSSQFQKLVQSGQLNEAEKFYADNRSDLYASPGADTARRLLTQRLSAGESANYPPLIKKLESPAGLAEWPQMRRDLQLAATYLQHINMRPILSDNKEHIEHYKALEQTTKKITNSLQDDSGNNLITFAKMDSGYFPTKYPVILSQQELHQLSAQTTPRLMEVIKQLPTNDAQAFIKHNHNWMDKSSLQKITKTYLDIYAKQNSIKQPMSLATRLNALKQIGLDTQVKIVTVPVTSTNLDPLSRNIDSTALAAPEATLSKTNARLLAEGFDLALYAKPGKASGTSRIQSEKTEAARYVDGTHQIANPEFEEKQNEIQRVRDDLDAAYRANVQLQQQASQLSAYGGNSAAFGAIASQVGNYSLQHGEQKIAQLQQELANTPRTINENTYKTYHRLLTTHKVDASMNIHYLLVDLHTQQAYRFDETLTNSKTVGSVMPESVDPRDPNPPAAVDTGSQGLARELSDKWPERSRLSREKVLQAANGKSSKAESFESWLRN